MEQKVLRTGAWAIACALILRLIGPVTNVALIPNIASFLVFMQTGRVIRTEQLEATQPTQLPEESRPTYQPIAPIEPELPVFSETDAQSIGITSAFAYSADLPALMTQPLAWDLTGEAPSVLIVHTHGTESFLPSGDYQETTAYHTLNTDHNMVSIGAYVAELLESAGISVIHDIALHDEPSYNAAYTNSRKSVQTYLQAHPSIRLVLDLHRDAIEDANGNQLVHAVFSEGQSLAPLMLVVGTNYGGLEHPKWQENLSLALKLQTQLESICPGICRNINLRTQRFNQDLSTGALLVEVGTSGNTHREAMGAAQVLAEAVISLARGSG